MDIRNLFAQSSDPNAEECRIKTKEELLEQVVKELKSKLISKGEKYSSLELDIFANFRDLEDLMFLAITRLKANRMFNSVAVSLKQGEYPTLPQLQDHIIDMIVYLILYYGFLDDRDARTIRPSESD